MDLDDLDPIDPHDLVKGVASNLVNRPIKRQPTAATERWRSKARIRRWLSRWILILAEWLFLRTHGWRKIKKSGPSMSDWWQAPEGYPNMTRNQFRWGHAINSQKHYNAAHQHEQELREYLSSQKNEKDDRL